MLENGTKDAAVDGVYRGVLDYLSAQAHKIAYPELIVPCVVQLKAFLKKSKVANYRDVQKGLSWVPRISPNKL